MLMIQKPKCEIYDITIIETSSESHLHWKDDFHENPLHFRIIADFEPENENEDNKAVCNKTANVYKQNDVCIDYYIISELDDVLESGYYKFPIKFENVDWFVDEVTKLEVKMTF